MKTILVVGLFAALCFGSGVVFNQLVGFEIVDQHVVKIPNKRTVTIINFAEGWHPSFEKDKSTITFDWSEEDPLSCGPHKNASGCAWFREDDNKCRILLNPIQNEPTVKDLLLLGHETLHCIRGNWHDKH
jgi:hypothetical protein